MKLMKNIKFLKNLISKKVFIFDFDGVIVNSNYIKAENFYKIFNINDEILKKTILNYHNNNIGISRYQKIDYFVTNYQQLSKFKNKKNYLAKKFRNLCIKEISLCDEIPGALNFLKTIKENNKEIILCSATPLNELKQILINRNIYKIFDKIYGYPDNKYEIIAKLIIKKSIDLKNFIYFGDSNSDYEAAKKNKIDFVHINSNDNFINKNNDIISINDFNI